VERRQEQHRQPPTRHPGENLHGLHHLHHQPHLRLRPRAPPSHTTTHRSCLIPAIPPQHEQNRIWLRACSVRAARPGCGGQQPPSGLLAVSGGWRQPGPADGHGQAVNRLNWRSCTFFLQSAISKRRDHTDPPIGLGPGTRMNVQRRPRCTFILLTSASRGGKTLE